MKRGSTRRRYAAIAILAILSICAVVPAIASARVTVPPGSSEGDQYFEEIPNGGGSGSPERGDDGAGGAGGGGGGQAVAADQALRSKGADGAAAADLANANRPPVGKVNAGAEAPSSSTEGEGGMGALLPILLAVTALGAIAYGLRRRLSPA